MAKLNLPKISESFPVPNHRDGHNVVRLPKEPNPFGVSINKGHTQWNDSENPAKGSDKPDYARDRD